MSLQERFTGGPEPRRLRAVHRSAACCAEQEIACSASLPLPVVLDASEVIEEAGHDARHAALLVEEPLAPDRRIRRIDLFISRTTAMLAGGSGDYLVALHLYAGSSLHRAVVTMSYSEAPADWQSWSGWFQSFVGVPSDEVMSVLYYDAEWISDHRDRLLRKALEPGSREAMPFPATAFWRRHYLIESSDIHIQHSM
ncbi:hypothetical protein ACTHPH_17710 [Paenibacillus pasadenensis]|uniref:Uncharacterized protein n=1 Tax=Paenibacillus pasadenensis TaxID=217090 RepID=A0A2N5NBQ5_9BACL|nr:MULTISPECIES: hypothetical protein [Paenibacillus]PLT47772.1 hypothetical protein B8V81_0679 [Paenibacillus pasadenensis]QGG57959.1 hypothetical protein GE073_21890 [Paenibacillus sp. B01]